MRILFVGDLYAQSGVDFFIKNLDYLRSQYSPNLIIVNAENAHNGRGINLKIYKQLMKAGVAVITMGNHTWKNPELKTFINDSNIIRPVNDGSGMGNYYKILNYNGKKIIVINALGKAFMNESYESPFLQVEKILDTNDFDYSFLDMHAEATSEKLAMAYFLGSKIDCIVGTHTHVQTNDDRILTTGAIYITDVGMTGPLDGVIGVKPQIIIDRFVNNVSNANEVQIGKMQLNAVLITLEPKRKIEKIHIEG